jgi:sigma-B regulation protein RsbU (phosphoserine phosphatase)
MNKSYGEPAQDSGGMGMARAMALGSTRLEALLEAANMLHASQNLEDMLRHLLRTVMGRLLAGRGFIAIEESGALRLSLVRGTRKMAAGELLDLELARDCGMNALLPIGDPEKPVGLLGVASPPDKEIDAAEHEFVNTLLGIAASGITKSKSHTETNRLNQALGQKLHELRTLLDLARGFSGALDPGQVAQLLGLTMAGRWAVRKYAIAAWREGHPLVLRQKGMDLADIQRHGERLANLPDAVRTDDLSEDEFKVSLAAQAAALLIPLRSSDKTIGAVILGSRSGKQAYTEADLEFGQGVAAQAVVAFENAWYFRETLEKRRMEKELALAASIQAKLFPEELPELWQCVLAAHNRPALQCGGDYYDVLPMSGAETKQSHLLCMADVSGKGLPAAILMSNLQATLRASLPYGPSLVELATRTNALLHATTPSNKYITAILCVFDPVSGKGRYVNAGHNGGVVVRVDGTPEVMKATSAPLGLLPGMSYEQESFELQPGDTLMLYSDGVPEAFDLNEEEWGEERMLECLGRCHQLSPKEIVARMLEGLDAFVGTAPPHDDITLLVLRRRR